MRASTMLLRRYYTIQYFFVFLAFIVAIALVFQSVQALLKVQVNDSETNVSNLSHLATDILVLRENSLDIENTLLSPTRLESFGDIKVNLIHPEVGADHMPMDDVVLPSNVIRRIDTFYLSSDIGMISKRIAAESNVLKHHFQPGEELIENEASLQNLQDAHDILETVLLQHDTGFEATSSKMKSVNLVIGVMSARSHFDQRMAIRDTWANSKDIRDTGVAVKFFVGDKGCDIHPQLRLTHQGCNEIPLVSPVVGTLVQSHHISSAAPTTVQHFSERTSIGTDFALNWWVSISHIGVYDSLGDGLHGNLSTAVWDVDNKNIVTKVAFSPNSMGDLVGCCMRYKKLASPLVLPRGFRGSLVVQGHSKKDPAASMAQVHRLDDGGGLVRFTTAENRIQHVDSTDVFPTLLSGNLYGAPEDGIFSGSVAFMTDLVRPAMLHRLEWKRGATYDRVDMYPQDQLHLLVHSGCSDLHQYANVAMARACNESAGRVVHHSQNSTTGMTPTTVLIKDLSPGSHFFTDRVECHNGRMMLEVHVLDPALDRYLLQRHNRSTDEIPDVLRRWKAVQRQEQDRLDAELRAFDDMVPLNLVDTYSMLPRKVLYFYQWAALTAAQFALKTDDDCYVNVHAISMQLKSIHPGGTPMNFWWSQFRESWPVAKRGKWAEHTYTASTYPAFACGSGGVLSVDVVRWLARLAPTLKTYQGEDVSVGIWLAAMAPRLVRDARWRCFKGCERTMLTSPEHSPAELRTLWAQHRRCGNPCGCPESDTFGVAATSP